MVDRSDRFPPEPYSVQEMTKTQARRELPELIPEEDAWFYSPRWQGKLTRAQDDIVAGRVSRATSAAEMFAELDRDA